MKKVTNYVPQSGGNIWSEKLLSNIEESKEGKRVREDAAQKYEVKCKDGAKRHPRGVCWNLIRPFMDKNTDNAKTNQAWEKQRRIPR